jgi:plasmid stabilization system protein ParE
MMQNEIIYSKEALTHLDKLSDFLIVNAGKQVANDIIEELIDKLDILKDMSYIGREHPDTLLSDRGYRILILGQYVGVYSITHDGILISGIYHTKTDWLRK